MSSRPVQWGLGFTRVQFKRKPVYERSNRLSVGPSVNEIFLTNVKIWYVKVPIYRTVCRSMGAVTDC